LAFLLSLEAEIVGLTFVLFFIKLKKVFAPLLDKIIEEYHHYSPDAKHTSNWDISSLHLEDFNVKHGGDYVISTRVRIARNLADFPLGTNISTE